MFPCPFLPLDSEGAEDSVSPPAGVNTLLLNRGMTSSSHFKVLQPLENSTVWAAARVLSANRQLINPKAGSRSAELSAASGSLPEPPCTQVEAASDAPDRSFCQEPGTYHFSAILKANSEARVIFFALKNKITPLT